MAFKVSIFFFIAIMIKYWTFTGTHNRSQKFQKWMGFSLSSCLILGARAWIHPTFNALKASALTSRFDWCAFGSILNFVQRAVRKNQNRAKCASVKAGEFSTLAFTQIFRKILFPPGITYLINSIYICYSRKEFIPLWMVALSKSAFSCFREGLYFLWTFAAQLHNLKRLTLWNLLLFSFQFI